MVRFIVIAAAFVLSACGMTINPAWNGGIQYEVGIVSPLAPSGGCETEATVTDMYHCQKGQIDGAIDMRREYNDGIVRSAEINAYDDGFFKARQDPWVDVTYCRKHGAFLGDECRRGLADGRRAAFHRKQDVLRSEKQAMEAKGRHLARESQRRPITVVPDFSKGEDGGNSN